MVQGQSRWGKGLDFWWRQNTEPSIVLCPCYPVSKGLRALHMKRDSSVSGLAQDPARQWSQISDCQPSRQREPERLSTMLPQPKAKEEHGEQIQP